MPRPTTKTQLLAASQKEFDALMQHIRKLTPAQMDLSGTPEEWSVKDFTAHLLEWQKMFFGWYEAGLRGEIPPTPAEGYKWNQLPELNLVIYRKYQDRCLDELLVELRDSHQRTIQLVFTLSEEDLFTPGRFSWTRTNTLAAYINSNTSGHYLWARKEIQKNVNNLQKRG